MSESKSGRKLEPQHLPIAAAVPTTGDKMARDQDERDHPIAAAVPTTGANVAGYGFCAKCGQQKASDSHYVCKDCRA